MREFADEKGGTWRLSVTVAAVRQVRQEVGFDLATILSPESAKQLSDPVLLVDVLACLLAPQINARQMTAVDFAECLFGDAIERAATALVEAVADFLPSAQRQILTALWGTGQQVRAQAVAVVQDQLDSLLQNFGESSTSLRDEQASTQDTEP